MYGLGIGSFIGNNFSNNQIIPNARILIKKTVCLLNENHNYVNYNYEHLIDLLNTINSRLEITIVYWINIDNEICKLFA